MASIARAHPNLTCIVQDLRDTIATTRSRKT